MAYEYLTNGATSLANASWSAATGTSAANFTLVISGGSQAITADVDRSGAQVGRSFEVAKPFTGSIGTEGSPLKLKLTDGSNAQKTSANSEAFFRHSGSGPVYLTGGTTVDTDSIDNVFIDGGGTLTLVAGNFPYVHITQGRLNILTNVIVQNLEVYGGTVTIAAAASTNMTTIKQFGGTITLERPVSVSPGTIEQNGGTLTYAYEGTTDTTVYTQEGGVLNHRSGDITTYNHNAGEHDATNLNRETIITTCIRKPYSKFKGVRVGGLLTITNDRNIGFLALS